MRAGAGLVYSTAPPYSPHLVGLALRSIKGIRWIMELRDPWTDNDHKPWWVRTGELPKQLEIKSKIQNGDTWDRLGISTFVLWNCCGFRASDFGFRARDSDVCPQEIPSGCGIRLATPTQKGHP